MLTPSPESFVQGVDSSPESAEKSPPMIAPLPVLATLSWYAAVLPLMVTVTVGPGLQISEPSKLSPSVLEKTAILPGLSLYGYLNGDVPHRLIALPQPWTLTLVMVKDLLPLLSMR